MDRTLQDLMEPTWSVTMPEVTLRPVRAASSGNTDDDVTGAGLKNLDSQSGPTG